MDLKGFHEISTNCDILLYIYKLLSFKDQLKLAQVNDNLRNVFENFIWTVNYANLTVAETFPDYLVANETNENRLLLKAEVFQEFLSLYAENVQKLTSYSHLDLRQFKNLTSLRCCAEICWLELIESVAENLPHLQRIHLLSHRQDQKIYFTPYIRIHMFGAMADGFVTNEFVESLLRMKNLKELSLDYRDDHPIIRIKYQHFCQLLSELKLEILKLSFVVEPADATEDSKVWSITKPTKLKELQITTTFQREKWGNIFSLFLEIFTNLISLNVRVTDGVTEEIFNAICTSCENLLILTLQRTTFADIGVVFLPPKLWKFQVEYCYGLTYANLKQILTWNTLKEFMSNGTWYKGEFEDYPISPTIQSLALSGLDMGEFKSAYAENENLKILTWYPAANESRNLSHLPCKVPANLETLCMPRGQMAMETLLQLKHLQSLTTWLVLPQQWPYIMDLLKLPSLRELTIRIDEQHTEVPANGFPTNINRLKLFYRKSYANDLDFWLDLLTQNPKMTMVISPHPDYEESLRTLINHKKFPRFLKKIYLFGFTIKCNDLRKNFDVTIKQIGYHKNEFDDPDDDKYFIVLRRG